MARQETKPTESAAPEKNREQTERTARGGGFYALPCAAVLVGIGLLGRLTGIAYSAVATDIAWSDGAVAVLETFAALLASLWSAVAFAMLANGRRRGGKDGTRMLAAALLAALADTAARFGIDLASGALAGRETLALSWLAQNYALSAVFLALSWATALWNREHPRRAAGLSVLWWTLFRLALDAYSIWDFTHTYTNITAAEISAMAGQVLSTLSIYGGAGFLFAMAALWILGKIGEKRARRAR